MVKGFLGGNEALKLSALLDQGKMHFLHNMHFLARTEKIFCSKNIPNNHEIFLNKEVCQGPKNIQEFSQIFVGQKNEGCFGANVTEV